MTGTYLLIRNHIVRAFVAALMSISVILPSAVVPAHAATERALYLYYTHTKETARIVFKRNGQYVQSGLNELNRFLRDWRRNEPARMDPRLFDLVWEVYQEVGATQPINVVSAYRSPKTNEMLRATSSGVAENSQHTKGHAMDFFIPGIPLSKLRAVAMRKQVGGVGFYPTSGSPFVHLDTGSVRAWPRMTRAQLKDLFPDGRTMHLPTDGKPLSQEGYQVALAEWKQCHAYPCNGGNSGTRVASNGGGNGRTLMDMIFGGDSAQPVPAAAPAPVQVASVAPQAAMPAAAPIPMMRPADLGGAPAAVAVADVAPQPVSPGAIPFSTRGSAPLDAAELLPETTAPMPVMKSETLRVATASALPSGDAVTALAALTAPIPQPRLIMSEPPEGVTAYLAPNPDAQRTLENIIENNTNITAAVPPQPADRLPPLTAATGVRTASLGADPATAALAGFFSGTFGAAEQSNSAPVAAALADHLAKTTPVGGMRQPDLIAPDLEHVAEIFTAPSTMSSDHFAVIFDRDEADFSPATEMGKYVTTMRVGDFPAVPNHNSFVVAPLVTTAN